MPQGTDKTLLDKLERSLSKHAAFRMPEAPQHQPEKRQFFIVTHYAGEVVYAPTGLLDKNRDSLYRDLVVLSGGSSSRYLSSLFPEAAQKATTQKRPQSAGSQFRSSMAELVALTL